MDYFKKFEKIKQESFSQKNNEIKSLLKDYKPTVVNIDKKTQEYKDNRQQILKDIDTDPDKISPSDIEKLLERITLLTLENIYLKDKLVEMNSKNGDN